MSHLRAPVIETTQNLPNNLSDYQKTRLIRWGLAGVLDVGTDCKFSGGYNSAWKRDAACYFDEGKDDIWAGAHGSTSLRVKANAGKEHYYICEVPMHQSRHWGPFNQMGIEWFQSNDSNNSLHLRRIGRSYRKRDDPSLFWSWSSPFDGEPNKETRGYFFYRENYERFELEHQAEGFVLSSLWFQFRTTSGAGSAHTSYVDMFNVRFGWGDGDPSDNYKICLPKIRPVSQIAEVVYGDG